MIKQYGIWEFAADGKTDGNPFIDYEIKADISGEKETKTVSGFYDGNGVYKVRFMPLFQGEYSYRVYGSFADETYAGTFMAEGTDGHGMVHADGLEFFYADGTAYYSIGTTCYVWNLQSERLQRQTLETLKETCFNKLRFCIFPKHYDYNFRDPIMFPYEGKPVDNSGINKENFQDYKPDNAENDWDFTRFRPEYFQMLDQQIEALMHMGIEADLILFHPYDRWGFSQMTMKQNEQYIRYVTARFSAYRNVWWSLANEFDLCGCKSQADWEQIAVWIVNNDPYGHLRSIHNCVTLYDFSKSWVTHCSIQRQNGDKELDFIPKWLEQYKKPVVIDEMCYEGNIEQDWGNISAQEMLRRMWKTVVNGGYPGHGECYENENIWWSHGGLLYGESYRRFGLLLDVIKTAGGKLLPVRYTEAATEDRSCILYYFGEHRPGCKWLALGEETYRIDVIDTWNMTIKPLGIFSGRCRIELPGREYMALRLIRQEEGG